MEFPIEAPADGFALSPGHASLHPAMALLFLPAVGTLIGSVAAGKPRMLFIAALFAAAALALIVREMRTRARLRALARQGRLDAVPVVAWHDVNRNGMTLRQLTVASPDGVHHKQIFNLTASAPYHLDDSQQQVVALIGAAGCHILHADGAPLAQRPGGPRADVPEVQRAARRKLMRRAILVGSGSAIFGTALAVYGLTGGRMANTGVAGFATFVLLGLALALGAQRSLSALD